jgi:amino acid transporter
VGLGHRARDHRADRRHGHRLGIRPTTVISAAVATLVIIQSLGQVVAIVVLRRRQPNLQRPYRQWLYPVPTIVALIGWVYIYYSASWLSIGPVPGLDCHWLHRFPDLRQGRAHLAVRAEGDQGGLHRRGLGPP